MTSESIYEFNLFHKPYTVVSEGETASLMGRATASVQKKNQKRRTSFFYYLFVLRIK